MAGSAGHRLRRAVNAAADAAGFYLGKCDEAAATREIQQTMRRYLDDGVFRTVPHSLVLVQRTLPGGAVRCGVVGALDLEAYDYAPDSVTPIRATEGTVASRLPARVRIRAAAALEMPHIMVFYSDPEDTIRREAAGGGRRNAV
ncbi:MAG: DUF1015 family protein [Oscillospiraceae bacterium]